MLRGFSVLVVVVFAGLWLAGETPASIKARVLEEGNRAAIGSGSDWGR